MKPDPSGSKVILWTGPCPYFKFKRYQMIVLLYGNYETTS